MGLADPASGTAPWIVEIELALFDRSDGRRVGAAEARRHLAVLLDHEILDLAPRLAVNWLGYIAESAVRPFFARHRNEQAVDALDDLDVTDDEAAVDDDRGEGFQFVLAHGEHSNFRDDHRFVPRPSRAFDFDAMGA